MLNVNYIFKDSIEHSFEVYIMDFVEYMDQSIVFKECISHRWSRISTGVSPYDFLDTYDDR